MPWTCFLKATGKEFSDSPPAASWNCSAALANEWCFSKVIQSSYNIPVQYPHCFQHASISLWRLEVQSPPRPLDFPSGAMHLSG